jgi:hypothetical protein
LRLRRRLTVLEKRYQRLAKATIWRLQEHLTDSQGLVRPIVEVRAELDQAQEDLERLLRQAALAGTRLGRQHAQLEFVALGIPSPVLSPIAELPEGPALQEARQHLEERFTEVRENALMYLTVDHLLLSLKRSAYAAVSTVANTAYTEQQLASYRAVADRVAPLAPQEEREDAGVMLFFGLGVVASVIRAALGVADAFVHAAEFAFTHRPRKRWDVEINQGTRHVGQRGEVARGPCRHCLQLDGTVKEMYETFSSQGKLYQGPPLHPNCRCRLEIIFFRRPFWQRAIGIGDDD